MKKKAKDAILALVEKERDGEQIDRALLKNVLVTPLCRAQAPPRSPARRPSQARLPTSLSTGMGAARHLTLAQACMGCTGLAGRLGRSADCMRSPQRPCLCGPFPCCAAWASARLCAQGIFIEVGMGSMDTYDADFEAYLLADSATYYQRKAAAWIQVLAARLHAPSSLTLIRTA